MDISNLIRSRETPLLYFRAKRRNGERNDVCVCVFTEATDSEGMKASAMGISLAAKAEIFCVFHSRFPLEQTLLSQHLHTSIVASCAIFISQTVSREIALSPLAGHSNENGFLIERVRMMKLP